MKKHFLFTFLFLSLSLIAQSKKEVIQTLKTQIDSLNLEITNHYFPIYIWLVEFFDPFWILQHHFRSNLGRSWGIDLQSLDYSKPLTSKGFVNSKLWRIPGSNRWPLACYASFVYSSNSLFIGFLLSEICKRYPKCCLNELK